MQNQSNEKPSRDGGIFQRKIDLRGAPSANGTLRTLEDEAFEDADFEQPNPNYDFFLLLRFPRDADGRSLPVMHHGQIHFPLHEKDNPAREFQHWRKKSLRFETVLDEEGNEAEKVIERPIESYGLRDVLRYLEVPPHLWQRFQYDPADYPECRGCQHAIPYGTLGSNITCKNKWRGGVIQASSPVCHLRKVELKRLQRSMANMKEPEGIEKENGSEFIEQGYTFEQSSPPPSLKQKPKPGKVPPLMRSQTPTRTQPAPKPKSKPKRHVKRPPAMGQPFPLKPKK